MSFLYEQIFEYTILEIQFRSVNDTLIAKICKYFKKNKQQSKHRVNSSAQGKSSIYQVLKSMKVSNRIPHRKKLFFNIIASHIAIIYEKWIEER